MAEYDNNLRGALFRNEKKEKENQPDYTGNVEVEGTKYNMAGWMRDAKSGKKYMSISLYIPEPKHSAAPVSAPSQTSQSMDDEIPF